MQDIIKVHLVTDNPTTMTEPLASQQTPQMMMPRREKGDLEGSGGYEQSEKLKERTVGER
jgi:hypothetical protein